MVLVTWLLPAVVFGSPCEERYLASHLTAGRCQEHTLPLVEIWGVICVTVRSCAHLKSMSKDMLNGSRTGRNLSDQTSQDTSKDCTSAVCGKRSLANGKVEDHGKLHQIENCNDFTEIHNI